MRSRAPRDLWVPGFLALNPKFSALQCLPWPVDASTSWPTLEVYNQMAEKCGVVTGSGLPVRFMEATPKPRGRRRKRESQALPYEHRIWQKGEVSTRPECWHDYFNMLAWCLFPKTKAALNERQAKLLVGARNAEQNLLSIVDEGGVFAVLEGRGDQASDGLSRIHFGHALHEAIMRDERGSEGLLIRLEIPHWEGLNLRGLAQIDAVAAELILNQRLARDPRPERNSGLASERMV